METKTCCACKLAVPLDGFSRLSASKDGLQRRCKTCDAVAKRKWYAQPDRGQRREKQRKVAARKAQQKSKICTRCSTRRPREQFYKQKGTFDGLRPDCKRCVDARNAASDKKNAEKWGMADQYRPYALLKKYGLTLEQYNAMFDAQGGGCAICGKPETMRRIKRAGVAFLAVDHCHTTGKVRALLCRGCNHALGSASDDPAILRAMADYLERHA